MAERRNSKSKNSKLILYVLIISIIAIVTIVFFIYKKYAYQLEPSLSPTSCPEMKYYDTPMYEKSCMNAVDGEENEEIEAIKEECNDYCSAGVASATYLCYGDFSYGCQGGDATTIGKNIIYTNHYYAGWCYCKPHTNPSPSPVSSTSSSPRLA